LPSQLALSLLKSELPERGAEKVFALVDRAKPILQAIAAKSKERTWQSDIIGNTICSDLLAYIDDDARWSGMERQAGHYAIYNYFFLDGPGHDQLCVRLTKGGLRPDVVSAIMAILEARYDLTERVLFHHAKCVASAMLARAARLCGFQDVTMVIERRMGDEAFLDYLESIASERDNDALRLLHQLRSRRLHKRIFKVGYNSRQEWERNHQPEQFSTMWRDGQQVEALLTSIEQRFSLPRGTLVLWCPSDNAGKKLAEVLVVWDVGGGLQGPCELRDDSLRQIFPGVAQRVQRQEEQYQDLWTFWVAIDQDHISEAAKVVRALEEGLRIQCDALFHDTYLVERVPGYREAEALAKSVDRHLEPFVDTLRDRLSETAAYDARFELDAATVQAAMQDLLNAKPHQLQLHEPDTEPGEA
jgi:HD associated region